MGFNQASQRAMERNLEFQANEYNLFPWRDQDAEILQL
jgi:hypothetical protein